MDLINITSEVLNIQNACEKVQSDSCGAISTFVGTTRDNFKGKKVLSLYYETYDKMAKKEINKICVDIRSKWPGVKNICFEHRTGEVKIGEASVIIAISSVHRADSLDAVAHAIDELKRKVPIWKKEMYDDEPGVWKENQECSWK